MKEICIDCLLLFLLSLTVNAFSASSSSSSLYRWGAIGYSAFQVYTNPWLCQAIMAALVGYCRLAMAIR
jgi:hypothetical protein